MGAIMGWSNGGKGDDAGDLLAVAGISVLMKLFDKQGGKGKGKDSPAPTRDESKWTMKRFAKIEDDRKIYLGGLPRGSTWQKLEAFVKGKAAKPKLTHVLGFGKAALAFKTAEEAMQAQAALEGAKYEGKVIEADPWTAPVDRRGKEWPTY